jgi:signal transduction histidine kinase/ligand-binding sensor domain-containing protein
MHDSVWTRFAKFAPGRSRWLAQLLGHLFALSFSGQPLRKTGTVVWHGSLIVLILHGVAWVSATAAPAARDYFTHVWQTEDGLPQNAVTAILQTRNGYLWLGTYNGLARFDGVRFVVFTDTSTPGLQSSRVTSLFEDTDGDLWIGHETGGLTRFKDGEFAAMEIRAAWKSGKIIAMGMDAAREIWLVNEEGLLARLRDGLVLTPRSGPAPGIVSFAIERQGHLWIVRDGQASRLLGEKLVPVDFDAGPAVSYVQGICASRRGGLWVASDGRLRKWQDNRWITDLGEAPWGLSGIISLIETRDGSLATGTVDSGLYLVIPGTGALNFNRTNGLPQNWVRSLCEDREGNLWIGAGSGGLVALRAGKVATVNPPDQWQGRAVLSVCVARDGAMWIATEGAGIYRFHGDEWKRFAENEGLANLFVWSVSEDREGRIWAGTWGGGLYLLRGDRFERAPGLENFTVPVTAIFHAQQGTSWVGTGDGLLLYETGRMTWFGSQQGLELPDVRAVAQAGDGTIWFGMSGGGLGQLKDGVTRQFRKRDGLSSDFVHALRLDEDGTLWIGTAGGGLNRLKDGRFATINTERGLPATVICHIEEDRLGYFWMSSHSGILRVSKEELNRCANGEIDSVSCLTYGKGDGMPTLECSGGLQPAGGRTQDGRLWFPTTKSLVSVNPAEVKRNQLPPPVVIEQMLVESQPVVVSGAAGTPLRVPAGRQQFEFQYTGLSFTVPEKVRFRHRLEGLETKWLDSDTKRVANYSYLSPGRYTFHVQACNNDGVWNEDGAALAFVVLPHFWQTWWCRVLAGLLFAAMVAGTVLLTTRHRMRLKLERIEHQRAVERERARIAKDIHDDLGASLTRITMLSQSARGELDSAPEAAADVDRIYRTARELTRAMDEIVWAVNPQHDTLDSLATYLGRFAQDFLNAVHIRCRLDVPMQLPPWLLTAEVRHNLFLAFKEALNNAVRHADASEVRVSLTIESEGFALRIEDQGRGFAGEKAARATDSGRLAAGNGLANMHQRLAEIGGRAEIHSTPGKGTTVTFFVPHKVPASET